MTKKNQIYQYVRLSDETCDRLHIEKSRHFIAKLNDKNQIVKLIEPKYLKRIEPLLVIENLPIM